MISLHPLFGEHAVLQQGRPITISGSASPGAPVTVRFASSERRTVAGPDGAWQVEFAARPAGGPFELTAEGDGGLLRRTDLMLGEVWLCSGQSNMEWTLGMIPGHEAMLAEEEDPGIRVFTVHRTPTENPATEPDGRWAPGEKGRVTDFSAVAWYFARRLREKLACAVGLVVPAFGGTRIVSWLPREILEAREEYRDLLAAEEAVDEEQFQPHADIGRADETAGWETGDASGWEELAVPGLWQQQGWDFNGAVWYRKTVEVPEAWRDEPLVLHLGACDDFDDTFVNGTRVGGLGPECPTAYGTKRWYPVPSELTVTGTLEIAIRVFDQWGFGGIATGAWLRPAGRPEEGISLEGLWKAKVECTLPFRGSARPIPPCVLFNGMIHPLRGIALRGVLWYQGESDAPRAALYRWLLPDLIAGWRRFFGDPLLPFGLVQLANYKERAAEPAESDWAELRDAQLLAARSEPAVGLAVTIDVGEADNIHPRNKQAVGARLARWALATVYGRMDAPWLAPLAADHRVTGDRIRIRFVHCGAGLRSADGRVLSGFQIAAADRAWTWAEARCVGADVIEVHSPRVAEPVAVRFGWSDNPDVNLMNSAGLPASPFRTDDWPISTLTVTR